MASTAPPPPASDEQPQPVWAALPTDLTQRWLGLVEEDADRAAAFRACRRFARALLINSLLQEKPACLRLVVNRTDSSFGRSARLLQALVGDAVQPDGKGVTLVLFSSNDFCSPARCLAQLRSSGVVLTCVSRLEMQGLSLDTLIADAAGAVLPNLRQLRIARCQLTAAAADSLVNTACGRLEHVEVEGLTGADRRDLTIQLQQLAGLPSLSSISLLDSSSPTSFIGFIGSRLTALHLDKSYRQVEEGTQNLAPAWRATLRHAARCTALQSLGIPCVTSKELGAVAPALQQLRRLHLNGPHSVAAGGDAMVERLLGLPHLTSLRWDDASWHSFQRSHASSPCRWRELSFKFVSLHQLARLSLHSLTSPVSWEAVVVDEDITVAEAQAAVDNSLRRCPAGGAWTRQDQAMWPSLQFPPPAGSTTFTRGAGEGDTPAALLRALRPLLAAPGLDSLAVQHLAWDAELVRVLGEVLPDTCTSLCLSGGSLALPACVQLAKSLPWLELITLSAVNVRPQSAIVYLSIVAAAFADLPEADDGDLAIEELHVHSPLCPEGEDRGAWKAEWRRVQEVVEELDMGLWLTLEFDDEEPAAA